MIWIAGRQMRTREQELSDHNPILTVLTPDEAGKLTPRVNVKKGQPVRFADCVTGCCDVDVPARGIAGVIIAHDQHWSIRNTGDTELHVFNLENPRNRIVIPPDDEPLDHRVSFDLAGVSGPGGHTLTVNGPQPPSSDTSPSGATCTGSNWKPQRATRRWAVLEALCQPMLDNKPPPANAEIAERLGCSANAVKYDIQDLAQRFQVTKPHDAPRDWRRRAVARAAIVRGIIRRSSA